jgi:uncharacterized protein (UPF0297 family)
MADNKGDLMLNSQFRCLALGLVLVLAPVLTTSTARADEPDLSTRLATAWEDLKVLDTLLDDDDAANASITTYIELAVDAAKALELAPLSEEALEALPADTRRERRKNERSLTRFRDEVEDLLLEALDETELDRMGRNQRDPINRLAGPMLAQAPSWLEDEDDARRLARKIIRKIKRLERARHEVHADVFEGAFTALAKLGAERGLRFLMDDYLHTRKQPDDVARLRASLRGLRRVEAMSPKLRHALVDKMLKLYVANEALAQESSADVAAQAAKRFWDAIRVEAIALIQYIAGFPRKDSGEALATMAAFANWFDEHDDPRKAPWTRPLAEPS